MTSGRRRFVLLLVVLLGLPVLGAILVYVWVHRIADERWAAAQARIGQLVAKFPEADGRRDPETVTEDAKENQIRFVAAIRLAAPRRLAEYEASKLIHEGRAREAEPILEEAEDFLERVHEGARRIAASPSDFPPRWHGDWDPLTLNYMMHCSILRARKERDGKLPFKAAVTLLDSLQLARFWAISGRSSNREFALSSLPATLEELRDIVASESLSGDEFGRIARELEPLDAALQSPLRDLEPALARWAAALQPYDPQAEGDLNQAAYRWKYFLPARLMKAQAIEFADRKVSLLLALEGRPYLELRNQCRALDEETERSLNPLIWRWTFFAGRLRWDELRSKSQIRLLRTAAHYRSTGEVWSLGDPYGSTLHHAASDREMRFWSNGPDGKDDGGDPGKDRQWRDQPFGDIVIGVPR